jgi:hypothetical protein
MIGTAAPLGCNNGDTRDNIIRRESGFYKLCTR